jgi:hypothetical protein
MFGYIARLSSDDIGVLQGIAGYGNDEFLMQMEIKF